MLPATTYFNLFEPAETTTLIQASQSKQCARHWPNSNLLTYRATILVPELTKVGNWHFHMFFKDAGKNHLQEHFLQEELLSNYR